MSDIPLILNEKTETRAPKLAQQVAARIEQDIIRLGWPVGRNLGSEAELATRYGVGRWVLREAISIAASDGLLEIQRGRYGGLFVAAPAAQAVVVAIHNYLEFCRLQPDALLDARLELESLALRLAAASIDAGGAQALRELAATAVGNDLLQPELMRVVLTEAGNQVVAVFVLALQEATISTIRRRNLDSAVIAGRAPVLAQLRREQIEAVIAGDVHRIHVLQTDYISHCRELLVAASATGRADHHTQRTPAKRTEQMTHGLLAKITARGGVHGRGLGSEAELMAEFGVSRAVLREVIRPLERHGVVEMRAGRGEQSGLRIGTPDPAATARTAVLYLKYSKVPLSDIFEVQRALDLCAVASAAAVADGERTSLGATLLEAATTPPLMNAFAVEQYMREFFLALGNCCGNPVYGLFMRILVDMAGVIVDEHGRPPQVDVDLAAANCAICLQLAQAIKDGDVSMSRRHMLDWRRVALAMAPHDLPVEQILERGMRRE